MTLQQCKEDIKGIISDYNTILEIASSLPVELHDDITFISSRLISFKDMTYAEHIDFVRQLKKHDPDTVLNNYWMSYKDLVIEYRMKGVGVWFNITDSEEGLKAISGGKCKIVDIEKQSYTSKTIICEQ